MPVVIKGKEPAAKPSKYAQHLVSTPAEAKVKAEKSMKDTSATVIDLVEKVHPGVVTQGQPAMVTVVGGRTFNIGNYESVKLGVSLSMPSDPTPEAIDHTYEFASNWVSARMEEATTQLGVK